MQKILSLGNGKLDRSILGWSITPIKSCLNCSQCKSDCYAVRPYNRWPVVKTAWDRNFELAKQGTFVEPIIDQIQRSKKVQAVRVHVAGDFFNQDYVDNWTRIIKSCPKTRFYAYTKVSHLIDLIELKNQSNMNLINSIAPDGKPNYGEQDRINYLESIGYAVCPATIKGNDTHCGGTGCTVCQTTEKVCFHIH